MRQWSKVCFGLVKKMAVSESTFITYPAKSGEGQSSSLHVEETETITQRSLQNIGSEVVENAVKNNEKLAR